MTPTHRIAKVREDIRLAELEHTPPQEIPRWLQIAFCSLGIVALVVVIVGVSSNWRW